MAISQTGTLDQTKYPLLPRTIPTDMIYIPAVPATVPGWNVYRKQAVGILITLCSREDEWVTIPKVFFEEFLFENFPTERAVMISGQMYLLRMDGLIKDEDGYTLQPHAAYLALEYPHGYISQKH
jgi:hypothetical protein